jgi:hypothetical protein
MKTMPVDIQRLQTENAKSIVAVNNTITRLSDLSDDGLPLSDAIAVNAQLARAQGDKIDPAVEARLDVLAARLDDAIRDDFKLHATLDVILVALNAAEEISLITSNNVT